MHVCLNELRTGCQVSASPQPTPLNSNRLVSKSMHNSNKTPNMISVSTMPKNILHFLETARQKESARFCFCLNKAGIHWSQTFFQSLRSTVFSKTAEMMNILWVKSGVSPSIWSKSCHFQILTRILDLHLLSLQCSYRAIDLPQFPR